ncbi:MAG: hypothetical protein H5T86_09330 [Armatimonadetes bacterium]|nr:hypothetical protein [Armatimonadota bacterium]
MPSAATSPRRGERLITIWAAARRLSQRTGLRITYRSLYNRLRYRNRGVPLKRITDPRTGEPRWAIPESALDKLERDLRGER